MLRSIGKTPIILETTRRHPREPLERYTQRLASEIQQSRSQAVWLCIPPGQHTEQVVTTVLECKKHLMIEKPWLGSIGNATAIAHKARKLGLIAGMNFEYCLLDGVKRWTENSVDGYSGYSFSGAFSIKKQSRHDIDPIQNLGCHLVAIQRWAADGAAISTLECTEGLESARHVALTSPSGATDLIDFSENKEPILQRTAQMLEASTLTGQFRMDMDFAASVSRRLEDYRKTPP